MSTAAALATGSPLQMALQISPDQAVPAAASTDFAGVLAAASVSESLAAMPEGMPSAAALAWLAGFGSIVQPAQPQTQLESLVDDYSEVQTEVLATGSQAVSPAQLSVMQGMLANVVADAARVPAEDSTDGIVSAAVGRGSAAVPLAAPVAVPLAAALANSEARPESAIFMQGEANADPLASFEGSAQPEADRDSSMGERLLGALAARLSGPEESAESTPAADRNPISGPGLYSSTREAVGNTAGAVSDRPEVVRATVGSPRWANELGSRLAMMSVRGQHEGSLTLTPEHLGPLEVRISGNQDATNVWFGAQHADTRAALAEALPRLREMFAASGLALGQAGVSHEMPRQEARQGEGPAPQSGISADSADAAPVVVMQTSRGLLDTWA